MRVFAMSGSLQAASSNTRFVLAARELAPGGVEVDVFESVAALPHFNPDLVAPRAVTDFRERIAAADGVLIVSPEYAHEMPGSLKNALDWVVGSGELYDKRVAVVVVSPRPNGGVYAREAIERTLGAQGSTVVSSITIGVVKHEVADDRAFLDRVRGPVAEVFEAFRRAPPAGDGS
jgi:chromate reductase, NAD(P)H dehydrogenase (quinone)